MTQLLELAFANYAHFTITLLVALLHFLWQHHRHWLILELLNVGRTMARLLATFRCRRKELFLLLAFFLRSPSLFFLPLVQPVGVQICCVNESMRVILSFRLGLQLFKLVCVNAAWNLVIIIRASQMTAARLVR